MFCSITSTAISGVDALPVYVEADVSEGMPVFNIIGSLSQRTKEAADRVKTAMRNLGIVTICPLPQQFSPPLAGYPKTG